MTRRRALITGATGGLGTAVAHALIADGLSLLLTARDAEKLARLAHALRDVCDDAEVSVVAADLATDTGMELVLASLSGTSPIDVLVNNAAVQGPVGRFDTNDWPAWQRTLAFDLVVPARLAHTLLPGMRARGWGRVLNISGGGAASGRPDVSAYATAKAGLVRLTETLAQELAGSGVTVNAIAPGPMRTRMLDDLCAAGPDVAPHEHASAMAHSADPLATPDRAAALISWLASPAADGVSGRLLSARWDPWPLSASRLEDLTGTDIYTLRRIEPTDRGRSWS